MRNMERYATFTERDGEMIEVGERFGYLEISKQKLNEGLTVLDLDKLEEIDWKRYWELMD